MLAVILAYKGFIIYIISIPYNFIAFLIPVFSALRLAKFNVDTRQAENFIGMPTPANAILIASFPIITGHHNRYYTPYLLNPYVLSCFVIVMCTLLVLEMPMMSLKFKNKDFNKNIYRYLLLLFSAILILFFKFAAVPVVILFYIILSIIQFKFAHDTIMSGSKINKTHDSPAWKQAGELPIIHKAHTWVPLKQFVHKNKTI